MLSLYCFITSSSILFCNFLHDIKRFNPPEINLLIKFIKNKTEEICKLAVKQNGYLLKYIDNELKTEEICKLAVQQNVFALKFAN
jgi:hypothetical protein